jgi:hypothetical protein
MGLCSESLRICSGLTKKTRKRCSKTISGQRTICPQGCRVTSYESIKKLGRAQKSALAVFLLALTVQLLAPVISLAMEGLRSDPKFAKHYFVSSLIVLTISIMFLILIDNLDEFKKLQDIMLLEKFRDDRVLLFSFTNLIFIMLSLTAFLFWFHDEKIAVRNCSHLIRFTLAFGIGVSAFLSFYFAYMWGLSAPIFRQVCKSEEEQEFVDHIYNDFRLHWVWVGGLASALVFGLLGWRLASFVPQ